MVMPGRRLRRTSVFSMVSFPFGYRRVLSQRRPGASNRKSRRFPERRRKRMELGKLGVWLSQEMLSAKDAQAQARRVEAWGYRTLWHPEAAGRDVMVHAGLVLAHTNSLILATGIANIYGRDPYTCASGQLALAEAS